jgi:hypothetical protein
MERLTKTRLHIAQFRQILGDDDSNEDLLDLRLMLYYIVLKGTRYLQPHLCQKFPQINYYGSQSDIKHVFTELSGHTGWLNNREFQQKNRIPQETFLPILEMVKQTAVFLKFEDPTQRGPKMRSVAQQLGVFLFYLGRSHNVQVK